jgi:phosphoribosylanthranilate isomerase
MIVGMVFRTKICGVTNVGDALAAVDAGADAIGLNFYSGSKRCVSVAEAILIADALTFEVDRIGVFVNATALEIREICKAARIHLIQLHGDEPPEFLGELNKDFDIIRARRLDERGTQAIVEDIEACCELAGFGPDSILVDASLPETYGGTGHKVDWHLLSDHEEWWRSWPLILAGGLTPENVAEAIRVVRPHAVDVSSGVESSPGKKDPVKIRDFVAAAREAFS